jgi:hypothetical protein
LAETVGSGRGDDGLFDVLRLPALAMWWNHHAARNVAGGFSTEVAAQQVQAAVDGRGRAGGRENLAVVHVQDVTIQAHAREATSEIVAPVPMGRRTTLVEQSGRGDDEGAEA